MNILILLRISMLSIKFFNIALYIIAFILVGMFEYNYLFMFTYFSPIILFFVLLVHMITEVEDEQNPVQPTADG